MIRNCRRTRAYNRGRRVWAVTYEKLSAGRWQKVVRYTLTSGLECADWFPTAQQAQSFMDSLGGE